MKRLVTSVIMLFVVPYAAADEQSELSQFGFQIPPVEQPERINGWRVQAFRLEIPPDVDVDFPARSSDRFAVAWPLGTTDTTPRLIDLVDQKMTEIPQQCTAGNFTLSADATTAALYDDSNRMLNVFRVHPWQKLASIPLPDPGMHTSELPRANRVLVYSSESSFGFQPSRVRVFDYSGNGEPQVIANDPCLFISHVGRVTTIRADGRVMIAVRRANVSASDFAEGDAPDGYADRSWQQQHPWGCDIVELDTLQVIGRIPSLANRDVLATEFSPDGTSLAIWEYGRDIAERPGILRIFDTASGRERSRFPLPVALPVRGRRRLRWFPDDDALLTDQGVVADVTSSAAVAYVPPAKGSKAEMDRGRIFRRQFATRGGVVRIDVERGNQLVGRRIDLGFKSLRDPFRKADDSRPKLQSVALDVHVAGVDDQQAMLQKWRAVVRKKLVHHGLTIRDDSALVVRAYYHEAAGGPILLHTSNFRIPVSVVRDASGTPIREVGCYLRLDWTNRDQRKVFAVKHWEEALSKHVTTGRVIAGRERQQQYASSLRDARRSRLIRKFEADLIPTSTTHYGTPVPLEIGFAEN